MGEMVALRHGERNAEELKGVKPGDAQLREPQLPKAEPEGVAWAWLVRWVAALARALAKLLMASGLTAIWGEVSL